MNLKGLNYMEFSFLSDLKVSEDHLFYYSVSVLFSTIRLLW